MAVIQDLYNSVTGALGMDNPNGTLQGYADATIPLAIATAGKQFYDSGQYATAGEQAANTANPFGDRSFYKNKLQQMYTDPNYMMSDPSYQWRLNQGMANVNRVNNSQGYQGSGKSNIDLMNYAQGLASTEFDKESTRLANLAGAQFDPANASKYIMEGKKLELDAQNNALASLFLPSMMTAGANSLGQINNGTNNGGSNGGSGSNAGVGPTANQLADWAKLGWKLVSDGQGGGDVMDANGQQVGTLDQNGNLIPSYPTNPNDPRLGTSYYDVGGNTGITPENPYYDVGGNSFYDPYPSLDTSGDNYFMPDYSQIVDESGNWNNYVPPEIDNQYVWWGGN